MRADSAVWPFVPRPFAGAAFGSWFGRVAGRYRITVRDLAAAADLHLEFEHNGSCWLDAQPAQGAALARLCCRAALPQHIIQGMRTATHIGGHRHWYCSKCLFLNPLEVESPYWHAAWLEPGCTRCRAHPSDWECMAADNYLERSSR